MALGPGSWPLASVASHFRGRSVSGAPLPAPLPAAPPSLRCARRVLSRPLRFNGQPRPDPSEPRCSLSLLPGRPMDVWGSQLSLSKCRSCQGWSGSVVRALPADLRVLVRFPSRARPRAAGSTPSLCWGPERGSQSVCVSLIMFLSLSLPPRLPSTLWKNTLR